MKNLTAIKFTDGTLTYQEGNSIFTEKIVKETKEYYHVVSLGAGEELWKAGYSLGKRVYKK
tara:strand:+ start:656 stop:838 length:183 start_codon:yes stop_codon:yes gene_type:complete